MAKTPINYPVMGRSVIGPFPTSLSDPPRLLIFGNT